MQLGSYPLTHKHEMQFMAAIIDKLPVLHPTGSQNQGNKT